MTQTVIFDPLVPLAVLWALTALAAVLLGFGIWRRLAGWALRALAAGFLLVALAGPSLQEEDRKALSDIVILVVDQSASQALAGRPEQIEAAVEGVKAKVAALENTELRVVTLRDGADNAGTLAMAAVADALAQEPRARVAGVIMLSDGQVHDLGVAPGLPAPMSVLLTGKQADWDRRLVIKSAPAFAILGEQAVLTLRIDDQGAAPGAASVDLTVALDAEAPVTFTVPVGQDLDLPIELPHAGMNVLQLSVAPQDGELTDRNNMAVMQINGVRDRLRVLLVSGEPHAGERVWRNLLKSDPSVDLVHFTILRPPEKQDGIPVSELSLIAFPTKELFIDKIKDFDLIIFDTAPTGHTLRLLNFPTILEKGLLKLMELKDKFGGMLNSMSGMMG